MALSTHVHGGYPWHTRQEDVGVGRASSCAPHMAAQVTHLAVGGARKANVVVRLEEDADNDRDDADNEQGEEAKLDLDDPVHANKTQAQDEHQTDDAVGPLLQATGLLEKRLRKAHHVNLRRHGGGRST